MSGPLLPTPNGQNFNDGQSTENWRARKARERAKGYNGNGGGTPIAMAAKLIAEGIDPNSGDLPTSASSQGSEGSTSPRTRKQPFEEWFWQQVEPKWTDAWKTGLSEPCWEWQHTKATDGYGAVSYEGRQRKAHRVAWVLATGEIIPKGMYLCHRCDNPPCVNPEHLYVGTNQQNQRDAVERGQHNPQRGEAHGMARLTLEQVQEMRRLFADGLNQRELADRFGTTLANVHLIVRGKKWKSDPLLPTPRAQDEYERSNRKTIDRANMGEAQQTLTRWVKGNSPTSPSSAEWEVSILRLRALASGQSDRSSTSQPALPFSSDTGPESPDGEMSTGSPLLPTPSAAKHSPQRREDFTPNLTFRVQALTSSSAATPASPSPTPASAQAPTIRVTSGPSSPVLLASFDPEASCWRTFQATLASELPRFSQTLPRSGMTRDGRLYALQMSALPTVESDGSASLNVPTPTASDAIWGDKDHSRRGIVGNHNLGLTDWVKILPTPTAGDSRASGHRQETRTEASHDGTTLSDWASMLPTPTVRDHKGPGTGDYLPGDMLPEAVEKLLPTPDSGDAVQGPDFARANRPNSGGDDLTTKIARSRGDRTQPRSDDGSE